MAVPETHIFICTNRRSEGHLSGCCASKGSEDLVVELKDQLGKSEMKGKVRINKAGCLGQCARGIAAVVYPRADWYGNLTPGDAHRFFDDVIGGSEQLKDKRFYRAQDKKS